MTKLALYFYSLKRTFTSPAYYADVLAAPFGFTVKFFLLSSLLISLISIPVIWYRVSKPIDKAITTLPDKVASFYPADLKLTVKNGELTTNVPEPFIVKNDAGSTSEDNRANFVVIDTKAVVDDFSKYSTYALVTKTNFVVVDSSQNSSYRVYPLSSLDNLEITKEAYLDLVTKIAPYLKYVTPVLFVFLFLMSLFFAPLEKLLYLLPFAVLVILLGKIIGYPIRYSKAYQIGLQAIVIPTLLTTVLGIFGYSLSFIPFFRTLFLFIIVLVIFSTLKGKTPISEIPKPE